MKLERITDMEHEWYQKATALYQISFPVHEQREKASQEKILGWNDYHFYLILEENTFVGLLLGWETERFLYIGAGATDSGSWRRCGRRAGRLFWRLTRRWTTFLFAGNSFIPAAALWKILITTYTRRTTGGIKAMNWWCCPLRRRFPGKSTRDSGTIWSAG